MTLRTYLRIFRERFRVLAFVTIACIAVAVLLTVLTPKTYSASAQVFVTANGQSESTVDLNNGQAAVLSQVSTFAELIGTEQIIKDVQNDLHLGISDNDLRDKLSASAPPSQALVIVTATDKNADTAAALANSAAQAFVEVIEQFQRPTDSSKSTVQLFVTGRATAPSSPTSPTPVLNIVLGLVLGLLLGAAIAVARDILDNRVKNVEDLGKLAEAPGMGVIVEDPLAEKYPVASKAGSRNARAENFRLLRANLQFANVDEYPRVLAITSSVPGEGKSMVAMNLASTLAEAGFSVCLVDTDLRRPTVAKTLGLAENVGLTSVLIQQLSLQEALQEVGSRFHVLASGPTPPNPSEVLASSYVRDVIRSLLDMFDYVILDSAPLLPVADGAEVAALAEGTLLIARHDVTTEPEVRRSLLALQRVGARLVGVVLNGVTTKRGSSDYVYDYGYFRDQPGVLPGDPVGATVSGRASDDTSARTSAGSSGGEAGASQRPAPVPSKKSD